eukprot:Gb_30869 [translate_table: standard]
MGCVSSKLDEKILKDHEEFDYTIFTKPNGNHLVSLTSTTYGILNNGCKGQVPGSNPEEPEEVETINAWELMDGLEEESPRPSPAKTKEFDKVGSLHNAEKCFASSPMSVKKMGFGKENERPAGSSPHSPYRKQVFGSAKLNGVGRNVSSSNGVSPLKERNFTVKDNCQKNSPKGYFAGTTNFCSKQVSRKISHGPLSELRIDSSRNICDDFLRGTNTNSPLFDPELLASFEASLDNPSEDDWDDIPNVQKKKNPLEKFELKCPPGGEDALVLYTTSLRGIRKTFEDCNNVRSGLESFGICINERDVSMHLQFRNELEELMGRPVTVPRLFIKGRYIGAAGEVLLLHEEGKLGELLEGIPIDIVGKVCDGCGGVRFVPCLECSGSCKIVNDENNVVRCPDCNENGLIQCPICC